MIPAVKTRRKPPDWAQRRCRKLLVEQRRFLWYPESIAMFAAWSGLRPGMTVVDVGSGLGYMGYTYWPHFGRRGRYIGIDCSAPLCRSARDASRQWAERGMARFCAGDAYQLPLADGSADCVMCQTLLMHLQRPADAVREMARVLKPGGIMICHEPDNLSSSMTYAYSSTHPHTLRDELFMHRTNFIQHRGHMKLGGGSSNIGSRVPVLMHDVGMEGIGIRMNDKVYQLIPPYHDPVQRHLIAVARKELANRGDQAYWRRRSKREFIAGGGTLKEYQRFLKLSRRIEAECKSQIASGTYATVGGGMFYIIKGVKPRPARRSGRP